MVDFHHIGTPNESLPEVIHLGAGLLTDRPDNEWSFEDRWSFHTYTYRSKLILNGIPFDIFPGSCSLIPPRVHMKYHFLGEGKGRHRFCIFRSKSRAGEAVPAVQKLGKRFLEIDGDMERAVIEQHQSPLRAASTLLQVFWKLTDHQRTSFSKNRLGKACQMIEEGLSGPISVPQLARDCGCSHNTLTRDFQKAHGCGVIQFINQRRCERARLHLEEGSRPIDVAALVGIGDLQRFNKLMRQTLGLTPRQIVAAYK
jgi:AraC-like DNA-binding protein